MIVIYGSDLNKQFKLKKKKQNTHKLRGHFNSPTWLKIQFIRTCLDLKIWRVLRTAIDDPELFFFSFTRKP